jgi:glucosamine-6-phosphate deaminase
MTSMFSSDSSSTRSTRQMNGVTFMNAGSPQAMGQMAARIIQEQLAKKPETVLVIPTGKTPQPLYAALRELTALGSIDWRRSRLFHLDEYVNPQPGQPPSYRTFADEIDAQLWGAIPEAEKHYFKDTSDPLTYERAVMGPDGTGPDLVVLGIGANGHIAFNEPGSSQDSPSRQVNLAEQTIISNFGGLGKPGLPTQAMTLGLRVILAAKTVILLANRGKEEIVRRAFDPVTPSSPEIPASWLKRHPNVKVITDFNVFDGSD